MNATETPTTPSSATPAAPAQPATPAAPATSSADTQSQRGNIPEHLAGVTLKETFLPEDAEELNPGEVPAKTPEEIQAEKDAAASGKPPVTPAAPVTPTTPAAPVVQPKTTQNEEIIDKTKGGEGELLAGKYKTVEELKKAIEEVGGDHTGVTDPKELVQVYKVANSQYTKWTQRQQKANDMAQQPTQPEGFKLTDDMVTKMVDQLDFSKINDAKDMAQQMFRIMFGSIATNLPQMLPKQAPAMDPVAMAAQVKQVEAATDALGFIEAKVPRLTTDNNFRDQFALHIKAGKERGTYPKAMTRDTMVQAMKDFQKVLADMAGVKLPDEVATQDKNAAASPDGGGTQSVETTNTDEDILGDIVGAKRAHDAQFG